MAELEALSKLKLAGKLRFWRGTIEIPEDELHAICDEIQAEHDHAISARDRMFDEYTDRIRELLGGDAE